MSKETIAYIVRILLAIKIKVEFGFVVINNGFFDVVYHEGTTTEVSIYSYHDTRLKAGGYTYDDWYGTSND